MMKIYNKTLIVNIFAIILLSIPIIGLSQIDTNSTPCGTHENFNAELTVGTGTPYTHSSQVPFLFFTNILVIGDFYIDKSISLDEKNISILEDVSIVVEADVSLRLRKSNLFACSGLWNGISLSESSRISAYNSSIEDAKAGISSQKTSEINLSNTVFNRNVIGISLAAAKNAKPSIGLFDNNIFSCTSPINGTFNQITTAGIMIDNVELSLISTGYDIAPPLNPYNNSMFTGIENGIVVIGNKSRLIVKGTDFFNLIKNGIEMETGFLSVTHSNFLDCGENGILVESATRVNLLESKLIVSETVPNTASRSGIRINSFQNNSRITISDVQQEYHLFENNHENIFHGIHIIGQEGGLNSNINIYDVHSKIYADNNSSCIYLENSFAPSTQTNITNSYFGCSTINGQVNADSAMGIYSTGDRSNLFISENDFTNNTIRNNLLGIYLKDSQGLNNQIIDNIGGNFYGVFMKLDKFKNSLICSNDAWSSTFGGTKPSTGFIFAGDNTGTVFKNNTLYSMGRAVQINADGIIGPQIHMGNKWTSSGFDAAGYSIDCQGCDVAANRFEVQGSQSQWNFATAYTFYNPYYPIRPSPQEIFVSTPGSAPEDSCNSPMLISAQDEDQRLVKDKGINEREYSKNQHQVNQGQTIKIYPNPTYGKFTIKSTYSPMSEIVIRDVAGRLIKKVQAIENSELEFDLEKGIYFVSIRMEDGNINTSKVMVH